MIKTECGDYSYLSSLTPLCLQVSGSGRSRSTPATGRPNRGEDAQEDEQEVEVEEVEEKEAGNTRWSPRPVSVVTAAPARDLLRGPE